MSKRPGFADFEVAAQAQIKEGRTYLSENGYEATEAQVLALLEDARARIYVMEHMRAKGQASTHGMRDCWEGAVADALAQLWMARRVYGEPAGPEE